MSMSCSSLYSPRDAQRLRIFNWWLAASMTLFLIATALLSKDDPERGVLAYTLTALTILLLAGAARSFVVFLRGADELLRKIQLEALALSFGAAAIFMIGWRLCERLGAPKLDVDDPLMVMVITWSIGLWLGFRRYAGGEER